jgi:hypothetical protein
MSSSPQPRFTQRANKQSVLFGSAALTTSDGSGGTIGTNIFLAFTPGANDSYVECVRIAAVGSVASAATNATTVRIYLSTISSGSTTTSNTWLFDEIALPSITTDAPTAAINLYDFSIADAIQGSGAATPLFILVSSHVINASNTSLRATTFANDY